MGRKEFSGSDVALSALIEGDFGAIEQPFLKAGWGVHVPALGVLQLVAPVQPNSRPRVLISVGVHGDETAPIELLAALLASIATTPNALSVDLMVVVGNPEAIKNGCRYVDSDLNRLFAEIADNGVGGEHRGEPDVKPDGGSSVEAARAKQIMLATAEFFSEPAVEKWHLDLHTAIRRSHYPTFAVIPDVIGADKRQKLMLWLGTAAIAAVILNPAPAATFSAWSANRFGACSCTAELGQIGILGKNDLSQFAAVSTALLALMCWGATQSGLSEVPLQTHAAWQRVPLIFKVKQEIIKHSHQFRMEFSGSTCNFTPLAPGAIIAEDQGMVYRVGVIEEYVVFPNPSVGIGQRAGLMVVPVDVGLG